MRHFIEPLPDLIVCILAILILFFQKRIDNKEKEITNKIIRRNRKAIFGCSIAILVITFISAIYQNGFHKRLISSIKNNSQKIDTSIKIGNKIHKEIIFIGDGVYSEAFNCDSILKIVKEIQQRPINIGKTPIIQNNSAIGSLNNVINGGSKQIQSLPSCSLTASSLTINKGNSTIISWSTENAYSFSISGGHSFSTNIVPNLPYKSGSTIVLPTKTTTYIGTATGPGGTKQCRVTITVKDSSK